MASTQKSPATTTPTGRPRRTMAEIRTEAAQKREAREREALTRLEARLVARQNRARGIVNGSPKENAVPPIVKKARRPNQIKRELDEARYIYMQPSVPRHVLIEELNVRQFAGSLFVPISNTGGTGAELCYPDPLVDPTELFEVECLGTAIPSHVAAEHEDWSIYVEEDTEETLVDALTAQQLEQQLNTMSSCDDETMHEALVGRLVACPCDLEDEEEILLVHLNRDNERTILRHRVTMLPRFIG